jgi:hypothetical protein
LSSNRARIAAATISVALVLVMGFSGLAGAMVDGVMDLNTGVGAPQGTPRVAVTDLTPLPSLTDLTPLPSLTDLTPLPSLTDLTPLPSLTDITPLPSVSLPTPPEDPPDVELPEVTLEEAIELSGGVKPPKDEPDTGLIFTAHYPKGKLLELDGTKFRAITLDVLPVGTVVARSAVPAQDGVVTQNAVSGSTNGADPERPCGDTTFERLGVAWSANKMPIKWRFDKRSIPGRLPARKTKRKVKKGLIAWARPTTNCSTNETISLGLRFDGRTRKDPARDGVSVVDWGPLDGNAVALAYVWYVGSEIVEFDIRMNDDYKWTVAKRNRRRFQVQNVVAHEGGHVLGLGDLGDPHGKLTMFGIVLRGELKKTTLGRGDLLGAEAQSP